MTLKKMRILKHNVRIPVIRFNLGFNDSEEDENTETGMLARGRLHLTSEFNDSEVDEKIHTPSIRCHIVFHPLDSMTLVKTRKLKLVHHLCATCFVADSMTLVKTRKLKLLLVEELADEVDWIQ